MTPMEMQKAVKILQMRVEALEARLRCRRCLGSGSITLRDGDFDECPDCSGTGHAEKRD